MNHDERIESGSVIEHLERAVQARKAKLRDGLATELASTNEPPVSILKAGRGANSVSPAIQDQALTQMQAMLSQVERDANGDGPLQESPELADLRKAVHQTCADLRNGLTKLSAEVTRLADAAERRSRASNGDSNGYAPQAEHDAPKKLEARPADSNFEANGDALRITLESVPDFDGATSVQQALSDMPQAGSAVVIEFEDTSASIDVDFETPVSLREIMDQLREYTGHHYLVEQARPEEQRLRVRFIDNVVDKEPAGLRPNLWPKA